MNEPDRYVERICPVCGEPYTAETIRLKHGRQTTCSRSCSYELRFSHLRKPLVDLVCLGCDKPFTRRPCQAFSKSGKGKYCTRSCRDEHRAGSLHPQYIGSDRWYRGPNWKTQRRKARLRDHSICQVCSNIGRDVHHIVPFRCFTDFREANDLKNLITLCRSCHRLAEADFQRNEREGVVPECPRQLSF